MNWTIVFIVWLVFALLVLLFIYSSSPRRTYSAEDQEQEDQEQIEYLRKWQQ